MTSSSYSSQSTRPVGRVLWEELLVLSRFHSYLRQVEFLSPGLFSRNFTDVKLRENKTLAEWRSHSAIY